MSLKNEIVEKIKNHVNEAGLNELFREPLVGFASADDPLFSQLKDIIGSEHVYPGDILPEAKTVVAYYIPFSKEVVASNRKSEEVSSEWARSYLEANKLLNSISQKLTEWFDEKGIKTGSIKATHTYDEKTLITGWSHRSAAFIAGLGRFGVNRMLITPIGCAGRYGSVVISEEITPDTRPEEEFCLYYKEKKCLYCVKSCPTQALGIDSFDKHKCHDHLLEVSKGFSYEDTSDVCGKCVIGPCAIFDGDMGRFIKK